MFSHFRTFSTIDNTMHARFFNPRLFKILPMIFVYFDFFVLFFSERISRWIHSAELWWEIRRRELYLHNVVSLSMRDSPSWWELVRDLPKYSNTIEFQRNALFCVSNDRTPSFESFLGNETPKCFLGKLETQKHERVSFPSRRPLPWGPLA